MTFPGFSEPTEPVLTNDRPLAEDSLLVQRIAEKDNQIVLLQNAVNTLRANAQADTEADLRGVIENAVDHVASSTVSFESDGEGITVRIEGVILDSMGELVAPVRDWLIEGTITIPVSFVVRAANESEAEDLGVDALRSVAYDADASIEAPYGDVDVSDFGCGQADYELDGLSEN